MRNLERWLKDPFNDWFYSEAFKKTLVLVAMDNLLSATREVIEDTPIMESTPTVYMEYLAPLSHRKYLDFMRAPFRGNFICM